MSEPRHELVEIMASRWDELGHRPPTHWRWICTCGACRHELPDQVAALDTWSAHCAEHSDGEDPT